MSHDFNLISAIHNAINYLTAFGFCLFVLTCRGIGHKNLIRAVTCFFAAHALVAISVSLNLYYNHFSMLTAGVREVAATVGSVAIYFIGMGISDIRKTLKISQLETEQTQRVTEYLNKELSDKIERIDVVSKQQNRTIHELIRQG